MNNNGYGYGGDGVEGRAGDPDDAPGASEEGRLRETIAELEDEIERLTESLRICEEGHLAKPRTTIGPFMLRSRMTDLGVPVFGMQTLEGTEPAQ